jgi:hypothetical protein
MCKVVSAMCKNDLSDYMLSGWYGRTARYTVPLRLEFVHIYLCKAYLNVVAARETAPLRPGFSDLC